MIKNTVHDWFVHNNWDRQVRFIPEKDWEDFKNSFYDYGSEIYLSDWEHNETTQMYEVVYYTSPDFHKAFYTYKMNLGV